MTPGCERVHAQLACERQRFAIGAFDLIRTSCRGDITREAERVSLTSPSPQTLSERECLSGVAFRIVDPPGRKVARPGAQKNERWPVVSRLTAELVDAACHQWKRIISTAREAVSGGERRSDERYPDDDLPRSAEVEALFEVPDRAQEMPATEVGKAEVEQPEVHRVGIIGRFCGPYRGLGVRNGLVEPAQLGQHVGEVGPRDRRLDAGRP